MVAIARNSPQDGSNAIEQNELAELLRRVGIEPMRPRGEGARGLWLWKQGKGMIQRRDGRIRGGSEGVDRRGEFEGEGGSEGW